MRRWTLFVIALLISFPLLSRAAVDADELEVSVLTFGPGPAVYERYGHIAIRIRLERSDFDYLYDWGNFDFDEPNFVGKFVKGSLLYSMDQKPTRDWLPWYRDHQDRAVIEQVLNLDATQKEKLIHLLEENEKNPKYLYDYFLDNCATRVRDILDASTDHQVEPQAQGVTPHSYRWHSRRLMDVGLANQAMSLLMDFAYGPGADRPLTQWQAAFVPMELSRLLDAAQLTRADGTRLPLVKERRVLNTTTAPGNAEPAEARNPVLWALPIGIMLAALATSLSIWFRLGFWIIAGLWSAFATFGTVFLVFMIGFTRHWVLDWNENFLQFSPISLGVLAGVVVPRWRNALWLLPKIAAGLSAIGLAITISHLTIQLNAPAICLALPLHLAVMFGWKPKRAAEVSKAAANGEKLPIA